MNIKLIYDLCTPTRDRRPTFLQDLKNDIKVLTLHSEVELIDELEELVDDLDDLYGWLDDSGNTEPSNRTIIDRALSLLNDPGDGSPNILYLSIDGEVLEDLELISDPENATKETIIQAYKEEGWIEEDDE